MVPLNFISSEWFMWIKSNLILLKLLNVLYHFLHQLNERFEARKSTFKKWKWVLFIYCLSILMYIQISIGSIGYPVLV